MNGVLEFSAEMRPEVLKQLEYVVGFLPTAHEYANASRMGERGRIFIEETVDSCADVYAKAIDPDFKPADEGGPNKDHTVDLRAKFRQIIAGLPQEKVREGIAGLKQLGGQ